MLQKRWQNIFEIFNNQFFLTVLKNINLTCWHKVNQDETKLHEPNFETEASYGVKKQTVVLFPNLMFKIGQDFRFFVDHGWWISMWSIISTEKSNELSSPQRIIACQKLRLQLRSSIDGRGGLGWWDCVCFGNLPTMFLLPSWSNFNDGNLIHVIVEKW